MNWDYIAGFFDGEGCVKWMKRSNGFNQGRVEFSQKTIFPLESIKIFLENNGIESKVYINHPEKYEVCHRLCIMAYRDVLDFLEAIKKKCIVKKEKINLTIKAMVEHPVKQVKLRRREKDMVEDMLRRKIPYKFIMQKMNLKSTMAISTVKKQRNIPNYY